MEKVSCDVCGRKFKTSEALNQHKNTAHGQSPSAPIRKRKLAKGRLIALFSVVLLVTGVGYFGFISITGRTVEPGVYDEFAQCLTEKGAVFYGTYWCPHCADQKEMLGSSMKFINYVECDPQGKNAQPELCAENNIRGYPTWIIDGKSYSGTQGLERLSELTGCQLSQQ